MTLYYADTSAIASCYLPDEPGHRELRTTLLDGATPVVTSELTRLELVSTVHAAHRAGRIGDPSALLAVIDEDCQREGPIALLRLDPEPVLSAAADLLTRCALRTLDALHLAVARTTAADIAGAEEVVLVTRDQRQAAAARELGMPLG